MPINLIDVNAAFGGRESIQRFPIEQMLAQLERIPCGTAFVHSRRGMVDAVGGNRETLALCQEHPWLLPTATIDPRDSFIWQDELDRMLALGTRLVRLYPDQGQWIDVAVFLERIVERLAGTGVALIVDATTPGLPGKIAEATAEAGIPVIFTEARYYPLTELLPLAERYPHVFIETSRLTSPRGIEECVALLGAERLVFGSGTPRYPAWVAWQTLQDAAISEADREAIAWRNAASILGVEPQPVSRSPFFAPSWMGDGTPVIDIHLHDHFPGAPIAPIDAAAYAAALTKSGVVGGVGSSITAIFYDLAQGNDEMAQLIDEVPNLHGYVVVDPRYYEDSIQELTRLERDPRFVGVKIHCSYSRTRTDDQSLRRLFAAIAAYRKPTLIHPLGADWPEALVEIASDHRELPIIAAHAGYGDAPHPTHDAACRLAPAPNIVLEYCSTYLATGAIRRGIEAVGVERVMFGSDFPLISLPYMVAGYADAELSAAETEQILWRNAQRLFGGIFEV